MRQSQSKRHPLPRLWLMTDPRVGPVLAAVRALPDGSGVVLRDYHLSPAARFARFQAIRAVAQGRLTLLVAGSPWLAWRWGADGAHLGRVDVDTDRHSAARAFARRHRLLLTAAVHDMHELCAAERAGAAALFVSPVYPTRSHPDAPTLGTAGFAALAGQTARPVIALGGMTPARYAGLTGAYGWAAIDALAADGRAPVSTASATDDRENRR